MSYTRIQYPKVQAFDSNGNFAVGYYIYTFAAGTSTPATTYSERTLTTANTNPVVLDSRGEADIYVGEAIKLVFTIPGAAPTSPIWVVDYIGEQQENDLKGAAVAGTTNNNYVVNVTPAPAALTDRLELIMTPDKDNEDTMVVLPGQTSSTVFTGTGPNDGTFIGPYVGTTAGSVFDVVIDHTAPAAPSALTATLDGGAGNLSTGIYRYVVTYKTALGETQAGTESAPVDITGANGKINLTAIPMSTFSSVIGRKIYRTHANGMVYNLLTEIDDTITAISTAALLGATSIEVDSIAGFTNGQTISVQLDDGTLQFTTVSGVPSGNTIGLAASLTDTAALDNIVIAYTNTYADNVADSSLSTQVPAENLADTFKWKKDGGAYTENVSITTLNQSLIEGIFIKFADTWGHELGDIWSLTVMTPARVNLNSLGNKIVYKNVSGVLQALDGGDMKDDIPATLVYSTAQACWILNNPSTAAAEGPLTTRTRREITAAYQMTTADAGNVVSCNGTFTVTLPTAPVGANQFYYVKNKGSGTVTLDAQGYKIYGLGTTTGVTYLTLVGKLESVQLQSNGRDWEVLAAVLTGGVGGSENFGIPGVYYWTAPPGVTSVDITALGGGGGGGGGDSSNAGNGGVGGTTDTQTSVVVVPGTTYTIGVGGGGSGNSGGGNGYPGSASTFVNPTGPVTLASGAGGAGGLAGGGSPAAGSPNGGTGGPAPMGTGTDGGPGLVTLSYSV